MRRKSLRKGAEEMKLECEYEEALSKENGGSDNENYHLIVKMIESLAFA